MTAKFSDPFIRNLKPEPPRYVWDALLPAFGLYVGKRNKTFVTIDSSGKRTKLGHYPDLSLAEARKRAILATGDTKPALTLDEATEAYLTQRSRELAPGTIREYQRHLRAISGLSRDVSGLTLSLLTKHLDTIPFQSDKAHAARALKTFLSWCVQRGHLEANPLLALKMPKEPAARDRVLSPEELEATWLALETFTNSPAQLRFQHLSKLLILTGQRLNQISSLQPEWIDYKNQTITFPATVMKNRRTHIHHFSTPVADLLCQLTNYERFNSWPVFMRKLHEQLTIPHFTPHDWRRTYATISASLVPPHITERLLAHASPEGHVASIYNRFTYEPQLKEAATLIEARIVSIVTGA